MTDNIQAITPADEAEIKNVIRRYSENLDGRNFPKLAEAYTETGSLVNSFEEYIPGGEAFTGTLASSASAVVFVTAESAMTTAAASSAATAVPGSPGDSSVKAGAGVGVAVGPAVGSALAVAVGVDAVTPSGTPPVAPPAYTATRLTARTRMPPTIQVLRVGANRRCRDLRSRLRRPGVVGFGEDAGIESFQGGRQARRRSQSRLNLVVRSTAVFTS